MSAAPRVVASVGTYHRPFERLVSWLEPLVRSGEIDLVLQHGSTRPVDGAENHAMLAPDELLAHYAVADVVVLQGGAGGVMDARRAGRVPIVVPRLPVDDEAVDDHQVHLARRLAELGHVHLAESADELHALLRSAGAGTLPTRLAAQRPTDGVGRAVRALSRPPEAPPRRGLVRALVPASLARTLAVAAAQIAGAAAGLLAVGATPLAAAVVLLLVLIQAVATLAVLPPTDRARSPRPAATPVLLLGLALGLAAAAGRPEVLSGRPVAGAALGAAGGALAAAALHRWLHRRGGVVVVGDETTVRDVVTRWRRDEAVAVAAACTWRPRGRTAAPPVVADVRREVRRLVRAHGADEVVFTSIDVATRELGPLVADLARDGVACTSLVTQRGPLEAVRPRRIGPDAAIELRPQHVPGPWREAC
ncbi:MAG: glycosyltransferase [Aeromicrobium erythreum]